MLAATGIKRVESSSITRGSSNASARPATPLFQTQPSGCPFMAQMKRGFSVRAASCRPGQSSPIQGTCVQRSPEALGRQASKSVSKVVSVKRGNEFCSVGAGIGNLLNGKRGEGFDCTGLISVPL